MKNINLGLDKLSHKEKILLLTVGILAVFLFIITILYYLQQIGLLF